ncbi:MAG: leucine-rich repeat protein [Oscillospiraceae bacterium]|nr:leucine-rich repeat protein [Oscillospiraceae bacterium]
MNCDSLQRIEIPNRIRHIGQEAFSGCSSLMSITIPGSVRSIDDGAFCDCKRAKSKAEE